MVHCVTIRHVRCGGLPQPRAHASPLGHSLGHSRIVSYIFFTNILILTGKIYCRRLENNQITEIGPHAFQSAGRLKRMWADDHSEFATFSTLIVAEICPETSWGRCQPRHSTTIRDLQLCKYFFHSFFIYQNQVEPRSIRSSSNGW